MKNPHITTRLNQLMQQEAFTKACIIKEVINYQLKLSPNACPVALYEVIQDYSIGDLNQVLYDAISDLQSKIFSDLVKK